MTDNPLASEPFIPRPGPPPWVGAVILTAAIIGAALLLNACASFDANSAGAPLASRSDIAMTFGRGPSYTVRSTVYRGSASPRCELPDASNEIHCSFYWDYLKTWSGGNDWRGLDMRSARQLCQQAVWPLQQLATPQVIQVCAFNLLHIRFTTLMPDDVAPGNQ